MELRQLEYLVAVAEEGGFTRAAARLHVAQPGVSAQIRRLERELGEPLFDRSGRAVRLTAVGEAVLPYARAALAAVSGMRLVADEFTGLLRGRVVMGGVSAPSVLDLPGMRGRMGVVWREGGQTSPAARAFIERVRGHLPDLATGSLP